MGSELRELRRRTKSVQSTKKITKAMELIAASRIMKAQARVAAAQPYSRAITDVIRAMASQGNIEHPLLEEKETRERAAVLVVTSDRGLAGGYNANVLRSAGELQQLLREEGKEPVLYVVGRKGVSYYRFRGRDVRETFTGFSEQPSYADGREVADALLAAFSADTATEDGVDEIHIVHTEFVSMLTQRPTARRALPIVVEYVDDDEDTSSGRDDDEGGGDADGAAGASPQVRDGDADGPLPLYEFEPDADTLLDALLPRYVQTRVFAALLEAAASESASRRRAMKAASDNAEDLIKRLSREANQARQAEITQEISEIVGGAEALSG